jgi:hypothetical protein
MSQTNNNLCYCTHRESGQNKCAFDEIHQRTYGDHGWDPDPNAHALDQASAWENIENWTPIKVTSTPDNFDYVKFDFAGLYGVLNRRWH